MSSLRLSLHVLSSALLLLVGGCSSVAITQVANTTKVKGLRVQASSMHRVVAVFGGEKTIVTRHVTMPLPNSSVEYEVTLEGGMFHTNSVSVELNEIGTLKKMSIDSDVTADKALEALAAGGQSVSAAVSDYRKATLPKDEPTELQKENAKVLLELTGLMLRANKAAVEQKLPEPYPEVHEK